MTRWLAGHAVPLSTLEAGHGVDDLRPLARPLAQVRVLGLGEATHGTREFFQFKQRMVEFLVTRLGFRAVTIEASYPACLAIDAYVVSGRGDPVTALVGQGFSQLDTEEMLAMIEWLREYNRSLPEPKRVRFLGFDMQGQYQFAIAGIATYLHRVAPGHELPIDSTLLDRSGRRDTVLAFLSDHRAEFVRETSDEEFQQVVMNLRVLAQGAEFGALIRRATSPADRIAAIGLRDRDMAENIERELAMLGPGARIIVSGHNGHVQTGPWGRGLPALAFTASIIPSMGQALRRKFEDGYYALGTDFDRGSFQALDSDRKDSAVLREFSLPAADEGSVAWYLATAARRNGTPNYVVDLRGTPHDGPVAAWMSDTLGMVMGTGAFSARYTRRQVEEPVVLQQYFDGLAFIEHTTRARPLPGISP